MSATDGAKAHHRASSSRVVPAIPLALEARSRRSLERNNFRTDEAASHASTAQSPHAIIQPGAGAVANEVVVKDGSRAATTSLPVSEETSDETNQFHAGQSGQTQSSSSVETTSETPSARSTASNNQFSNHSHPLKNAALRPVFGSDAEPSDPSPPTMNGTQLATGAHFSHSTVPPHPDAPPFMPNGHSSQPPGSMAPPPFTHFPHSSQDFGDDKQSGGHGHPLQEQQSHGLLGRAENIPVQSHPSHGIPQFTPQHPSVTYASQPSSAQGVVFPTTMRSGHGAFINTTLPDPLLVPHSQVQSQANRPSASSARHFSQPDPKMALMAAAYLYEQYGSSAFADYSLTISHAQSMFTPINLPAHAVILARSPKFRLLLKQDNMIMDTRLSNKQMTVVISDNFLTDTRALTKAIERLYTGTLPDPPFVTEVLGLRSPQECMKFALSYAASGHFMEIDEIISCGADLATHFLNLENIDRALAFAIDGGIAASWLSAHGFSEMNISSKSSSENARGRQPSTPAGATYGIYSDGLLRNIFRFLFACVGPNFRFDRKVPQFTMCARLPAEVERSHTRSTSHLAHIRFGEMQLEDEEGTTSDPASQILSSVLFTLPFVLLKHFLEHPFLADKLGPDAVVNLAQTVVEERESRRKTALQHSESSTPSATFDNKLRHNLHWIETTERNQQRPGSIQVTRRYDET